MADSSKANPVVTVEGSLTPAAGYLKRGERVEVTYTDTVQELVDGGFINLVTQEVGTPAPMPVDPGEPVPVGTPSTIPGEATAEVPAGSTPLTPEVDPVVSGVSTIPGDNAVPAAKSTTAKK